jgi:hypothetical protein
VQNSGTAFNSLAFNRYGYNDRNEVTASNRFIGGDPADMSSPVSDQLRAYDYDPIGNRRSATWGSHSTVYQTNNLNQYTGIDTDAPQYDNDGNMTQYDGMRLTYNGENRLVAVQPQVLAAGAQQTDFVYDYMGRRVQMTVSTYDGSDWTQAESRLFVYDGWNLIEEIVDDGGAPQNRYFVWGLDLSQSGHYCGSRTLVLPPEASS